ncbi:FUSC family protein [Bordetella petrii]|uniref:Membrane protein n=1 Tax=Bordetella petrii (strain ATCC BAA-461 / DSM 12804 / CCUG 43448 / CIP 107267 / Se-1111R) TaxID=340100 RepID=A9IGI8_BORPD|nr:FUSC family protein [Bordetella petrii]CAP41942.1 putative membrane protein [Bordetella petrii]
MDIRIASIPRFLYSHYFFGGVRQGVGMLLPVMVLGGLFGQYGFGLVATFGAQCLAIIDQPGGPQRHRTNEMLGGAVLATAAVTITGAASTYPLLLWLAVIGQCFLFSMFSVFGKRGGLIGFAGMLIMTLTMHSPMAPSQVLAHSAATLGGALFYLAFSLAFSRIFWLREERQAMSVALFATADYMAARSRFYDENTDLDDIYRALIQSQSIMTEKHQAARDIVLRSLPRGSGYRDGERVMLWNMFVDMLQLLDTLVATHTDYAALRRALAGHDCLMFMRDALTKMSLELNSIALDVSRGRPVQYRSSTKAELRAIEYEVEQFKHHGMGEKEPEMLALIVQVLRRLRNASRIVGKLADHTAARPDAQPTSVLRINKSLTQFMSRQELRLGMLTSNLRLDSPYFRYATRVTLAAALAMGLIAQWATPQLSSAHSYWVLLTIIIIMKPGFALTRQRNGWRLMGTLIGCLLALALFHVTTRPEALFAVLLAACIMGNSLVQLNYMASAIFNTLFVVMVFHFVAPGTVSMEVIGERALDTALGCAIALVCSYVLPWWEARYMKPLARAATNANRAYLRTGLQYARAMQAHASGVTPPEGTPTVEEADIAWRLARKNVHIAFSNFAEAFYRMMSEPRSHQMNVPELNNLLIQNHIMASQITAAVPILASLKQSPEPMRQALAGIVDMLDDSRPAPLDLPSQFDTEGELAALAYPLKQMLRASTQIRQELAAVADPPRSRPTAVPA